MKKLICVLFVTFFSTTIMAQFNEGIVCKDGRHYIMGGFEQPKGTSFIGLLGNSKSNSDQYDVWTQIPKSEIDSANGSPFDKATVSGSKPLASVKKSEVKEAYSMYPSNEAQDEFPSAYYKIFSLFCELKTESLDACDEGICLGNGYFYRFNCDQGKSSYEIVNDDC